MIRMLFFTAHRLKGKAHGEIRDYMDPLPEVEMIPHDIDGLHILQLKVNAGHYTPYYYVGDGQRIAFVRDGAEGGLHGRFFVGEQVGVDAEGGA